MTPIHLTCTRRLAFDAAHRVVEHESKCKNLHGHRYDIEATFAMDDQETGLDRLGRVVDFGIIREKLGGWMDEQWDHTAILWEQDTELGQAIAAVTGQRIYYLPYNPTAENIARYLLETICPELFRGSGVHAVKITVRETPNCSADAAYG